MNILGINGYHGDSSAALIIDGKLVAALEEERVRRVKHWAGFPSESIKWCLEEASVNVSELDYITVSHNPRSRIHKKVTLVLSKRFRPKFILKRLTQYFKIGNIKNTLASELSVDADSIKAKVVNVEHHRAHMASSFFVSPYSEAAVASIDGFGDFVSTMVGVGRDNELEVFNTVEFPHSLGIFYTALTQFLGFSSYGDEYKVMGLSAYGKPKYLDEMREIIKPTRNGLFKLDSSFFLHESGGVDMTWFNERPVINRLYSEKLVDLLGSPRGEGEKMSARFRDIGCSVQALYEEVFSHILTHLYERTGLTNLALSGGCIQNSLANGKIYDKTPFESVYIPPTAHDGGTSIGSAFYLWNSKLGNKRGFVMDSPFWGPRFTVDFIRKLLDEKGIEYSVLKEAELIEKVAGDVASGRVVGWFQGRSEWGPRALGNRSILADPRREDMRDVLNLRIKKRESFRPFAPSVLAECISEWFERSEPVPFMEKVYSVRPGKRDLIPAVVHVDGSGRLQTVSKEFNSKYYKLITEFNKITGVPIILNTSFNENEPIVNNPKEALDCFKRTKMDVLVIEDFYITSKP